MTLDGAMRHGIIMNMPTLPTLPTSSTLPTSPTSPYIIYVANHNPHNISPPNINIYIYIVVWMKLQAVYILLCATNVRVYAKLILIL